MKLFKNISAFLGLALTFTMLIFLASCSGSEENHKPNLKVGLECAYAPFNWIQPSAKGGGIKISGGWYACGYDVYIAKKVAQSLGRELEIVKVDWDGLLPALTSGKIDAIIAGMSATKSRREAIDFTDEYFSSNVVVVMKKGGKFEGAKSINDFEGARITGQLGTIPYDFIDQMKGAKKETAMEDFASIISSLSAGKIDGYVSEKAAALTAVHMNPSLTYAEFEEGKGFTYNEDEIEVRIGVKKGDSLLGEINNALKEISPSEREDLMNKAVENSCVK